MMKMMHLRRDLNLEIATDDDGGNKLPLLLATIFALQFAIPDFHTIIIIGKYGNQSCKELILYQFFPWKIK